MDGKILQNKIYLNAFINANKRKEVNVKMPNCEYLGHKNFKDKDFVFLYVAMQKKNDDSYVGRIAKEYKFVKKELLPTGLEVGDIVNVELEENAFEKLEVVDINIIKKGGKA